MQFIIMKNMEEEPKKLIITTVMEESKLLVPVPVLSVSGLLAWDLSKIHKIQSMTSTY